MCAFINDLSFVTDHNYIYERDHQDIGDIEMVNIYIKERKENIKKLIATVVDAGGMSKEHLVGKTSIETGLSPNKIEEYIRTLIDAEILAIKGGKVVCIKSTEVIPL